MLTESEKKEIKYALNYYRNDLIDFLKTIEKKSYFNSVKIPEEIGQIENIIKKISDCG